MVWKFLGTWLLAATLGACASTENAGPELVGKVSAQPGNCFYRDAGGNIFIALCK